MDKLIDDNDLKRTFAYLDNITICGRDQEEHDANFAKFLAVAEENQLNFNKDKCVFSVDKIQLLDYEAQYNEIRPDPARLQPLRDIPAPRNLKIQRKVAGLFSHYSKVDEKFF